MRFALPTLKLPFCSSNLRWIPAFIAAMCLLASPKSQAAPAKSVFPAYTFKTIPKATQKQIDRYFDLLRQAAGFRKGPKAAAWAKLNKSKPSDIPVLVRAMERVGSSGQEVAYKVLMSMGSKALIVVDHLLAKRSLDTKYYRYSRRDKFLKRIGKACAAFGKPALPAIQTALLSSKSFQRRAAEWALAHMGKNAAPTLKTALLSSHAPAIRGALGALSKMKKAEVTPMLPHVYKALATIPKVKGVSYLKSIYQKAFLEAFLPVGGGAAPKMMEYLTNKKSSDWERAVAEKVLAKLGPKAKVVAPKVLLLLQSKDTKMQLLGAKILAAVKEKNEKAVSPLRKLLGTTKGTQRLTVATALVYSGGKDKASVKALGKALVDFLGTMKTGGWRAKYTLRDYLKLFAQLKKAAQPALPALVKVLTHPKGSVQAMQAIAVIQHFGKDAKAAIEPTAKLLKTQKLSNYDKRTIALFLAPLGKKGQAKAIPLFEELIAKSKSYMLPSMLRSINKLGDAGTPLVEALFARAIKVKSKYRRNDLAQSIGVFASKRKTLVLKMLNSKNVKNQEVALIAIAQNDNNLKTFGKAFKQQLQKVNKNRKSYNEDNLWFVFEALSKCSTASLKNMASALEPFAKKGGTLMKIYAKKALKKATASK